ncbi:MAG: hypothetical protein AB3A66_21710 [Nodularia sp. CChRGM 3473]
MVIGKISLITKFVNGDRTGETVDRFLLATPQQVFDIRSVLAGCYLYMVWELRKVPVNRSDWHALQPEERIAFGLFFLHV